MTTTTKNARLATIATRQRKTLVRDALFAVVVTLIAVISLSTISTASHVASTDDVAQR